MAQPFDHRLHTVPADVGQHGQELRLGEATHGVVAAEAFCRRAGAARCSTSSNSPAPRPVRRFIGVDGHQERTQPQFHAPAPVELDGKLSLDLARLHQPRERIGGRECDDRLAQVVDGLFETLGVADAGAQQGLAFEALDALPR